MHDIMIDLQTLSTQQDAAILSIGACFFDIETGGIGDTLTRHIDMDDSALRGHISADTVKFWLKQDESARLGIANSKSHRKLSSCLFDLREFVPRRKDITVWSNGATFDLVIIRNALAILAGKRYSHPGRHCRAHNRHQCRKIHRIRWS